MLEVDAPNNAPAVIQALSRTQQIYDIYGLPVLKKSRPAIAEDLHGPQGTPRVRDGAAEFELKL